MFGAIRSNTYGTEIVLITAAFDSGIPTEGEVLCLPVGQVEIPEIAAFPVVDNGRRQRLFGVRRDR